MRTPLKIDVKQWNPLQERHCRNPLSFYTEHIKHKYRPEYLFILNKFHIE